MQASLARPSTSIAPARKHKDQQPWVEWAAVRFGDRAARGFERDGERLQAVTGAAPRPPWPAGGRTCKLEQQSLAEDRCLPRQLEYGTKDTCSDTLMGVDSGVVQ